MTALDDERSSEILDRFVIVRDVVPNFESTFKYPLKMMAEGVGFEPTVGLPLLLISSQVPLTTQPPFQPFIINQTPETGSAIIPKCPRRLFPKFPDML